MQKEKVYQSRDALHSALAQTYIGKRFSVYGYYLPPIQELLPTIPVNDGFIDNLFLLTELMYL